jgi:hypothetical protein
MEKQEKHDEKQRPDNTTIGQRGTSGTFAIFRQFVARVGLATTTLPEWAPSIKSSESPGWWAMDQRLSGGTEMVAMVKLSVALFVDKACPLVWIVRDQEGNFWRVPSCENPWDSRQPFYPTEETQLEPVPGHYKYMLGLPY